MSLHVEIENVGGITNFGLDLQPGVNELLGANGAGKTTTMRAVSRLYGGGDHLEPKDGADSGTVEGDGVRLTIRKVVRTTGAAKVELADVGPLASLIDPGIKDRDARAAARIRALVSIVRPPMTEEAVADLAAGDQDVLGEAWASIRIDRVGDLLTASEKVRLAAHALKRQYEAAASAAAARMSAQLAIRDGAEDALRRAGVSRTEVSVAEAKEAEADAVRAAETARVTSKQRADLEAQQAEIRRTLGERPDPAHAEGAVTAQEAVVARIEATLAEARAELSALRTRRDEVRDGAARWDRQSAVLNLPVSGPTPDEAEALERTAAEARAMTERARLSESWRAADESVRVAAADRDAATKRAVALEEVAVGVRDRLGEVLQGGAASGLTVVDGRLAVIEVGVVRDFEDRLSDGQRIRIALRIVAATSDGRVVPLDGRYWTALDDERRQEFAAAAAEHGLYVVTERPTAGTLHVDHLGR